MSHVSKYESKSCFQNNAYCITDSQLYKIVIVIIINTKMAKFIYHNDFCLELDHLYRKKDQILFE